MRTYFGHKNNERTLSKNIARNSSNLSQNFANDSDFEVVRKVFCSSLAIDIFCWCLSKFHHRFSECIFCFDDTYRIGEVFFSFISCSAFDFHCLTSVLQIFNGRTRSWRRLWTSLSPFVIWSLDENPGDGQAEEPVETRAFIMVPPAWLLIRQL